MELRNAMPADKRWIFDLINEETVREMAFDKDPIEWEEHSNWYDTRMTKPNPFYIIMENEQPCGYVRFEDYEKLPKSDMDLVVSIVLDKKARARGVGSEALMTACKKLSTVANRIYAITKVNNAASIAMFRKCGFKETGCFIQNGQSAMRFIYNFNDKCI